MKLTRRQVIAITAAAALLPREAGADSAIKNGSTWDGTEVDVDIPRLLRQQNERGVDGLGLCVWATLQMLANYHNCTKLMDIFEQMRHERGGGWPERLQKEMERRGLGKKYLQHLGSDFEFVKGALAQGRPVGITYGYGEEYFGTISHWVVCVAWRDGKVAVLDDNYTESIYWMPEAEFKRRAVHPSRTMWAAYLTWSLPPSPTKN